MAGDKTTHPEIKSDGTRYLVQYSGYLYAGTFGMQWYGLNFNGVYDAGAQYDRPDTNSSSWERVWRIEEDEEDTPITEKWKQVRKERKERYEQMRREREGDDYDGDDSWELDAND